MLNGLLVDWLALIAIAAFTAACIWGWPEVPSPREWGTWGEWAGAIGATAAAVVALWVATDAKRVKKAENHRAGAYEILATSYLLAEAGEIVNASLASITSGLKDVAVAEERVKALKIELKLAEKAGLLEESSNTVVKRLSDALAEEDAIFSEFATIAERLREARELLNRFPHLKAAGFDNILARHVVIAMGQISTAIRTATSSELEESQKWTRFALRRLEGARQRARRADKYVRSLTDHD